MCRHATALALGVVDPAIQVIEAATLAEGRAAAPNAALMTLDLMLPDNRSVLGIPALLAEFPQLRLLVISGASNPGIERQVASIGAHGYLSKATSIVTMVEAMRTVLDGGRWFGADVDAAPASNESDDFRLLATLTPAQTRVLHAMESGRLNKQIAYDLGLSEITVKTHVKAILRKLGVANRTQAILMLRRTEA